ncbi:hypothetical protein EMCRGX_G004873 [Ephydatia muelleri]
MKSLTAGLADRLSKVADVPVAPDDESFITTAKASYEKNKASPSGTGGAMGSRAQVTRKRTKDTSGPEASLHTTQCRPVAKWLTAEHPGRRLTSSDCHNSQTDNCTEPLSDSSNDQGPGTTDGPGDQELDVIGAPNVCQNPVEVTEASSIVMDPCDKTTDNAMAAPTSVKNGADVITVVSREYEKIVKALAGDNKKSICRAIFANPHLRQEAVSKVSRMVSDECSLLCKKNAQPVSLFHHMSLKQAENFSWTRAISKIRTKAPTLFSIMNNCVVTRRSASKNKHKKGDAQYPGWCTAVAILLNERSRVMCGVQSYVSSVLFSTKIHKKVELRHMFSLLAIKACISPSASLPEFSPPSLMIEKVDCFLPSREDMKVVQSDVEVLVARILCDYIKDLRQLKKFVVIHIPHTCSDKMADKSEVIVLDVLHKNETKSSDMVNIMASYLGASYNHLALTGGDHITCEREQGAKRHVMCSNT